MAIWAQGLQVPEQAVQGPLTPAVLCCTAVCVFALLKSSAGRKALSGWAFYGADGNGDCAMIYVLYVIISANAGWTKTSTTIATHPTEQACAEAADKARRENPMVITYCVRTPADGQKTTKLEIR
jgi:hypothetical protein